MLIDIVTKCAAKENQKDRHAYNIAHYDIETCSYIGSAVLITDHQKENLKQQSRRGIRDRRK